MDRLKRLRRPLRASLTKTVHEVDAELDKDPLDERILRNKLEKLEEVMPKVISLDNEILHALVDEEDSTDEAMDQESKSIEEYEDLVREAKHRISDKLYPKDRPSSPTPSDFSTAVTSIGNKKTYKLPKILIKKFNGELTEWLSFWAQFQKIHEDEELHDSDKFQYLVQSMVQGTRAKDLVASYPQTAANYPKVIEALISRFGKKKLLVQVYVRELLKLVINNVYKQKTKVIQMYDGLESHLRALESLGVSHEQTAMFLYPMVESSLPEDILIAWQRSPLNGLDGSKEDPPKNELDFLMQFLRKEVENEDQRSLVQTGFSESKEKPMASMKNVNPKTSKKQEHNSGGFEDIPTVAGLHIGEKSKCVFCEKSHDSKDCWKAASMSYEEKKSLVMTKKGCLTCLRQGHTAKMCKSWERCLVCHQKHVTIMCPELKRQEREQPSNKGEPVQKVLQHLACSSTVILGTLNTTITEEGREKPVRIFFDPGSQRNYITKKMVEELKLKSCGEERSIHSLFGGIETAVQAHRKFLVKIKSVSGNNRTSTITVLDKDRICGEIPRMPRGSWMTELKRNRIWISDIGHDCPEIDVLIGAHMFAQLLTGKKMQLQNGLTALETAIGWILMGESNTHPLKGESIASCVVDMQISDSTIQDLWSLEAIGIKDPIESLSQHEKEETAKQHFLKTVTQAENGRYSVRLPWINGKQVIPDNRKVAEKRLESATKKLIETGKFKDYQNIFKSWLDEGLIEEVLGSEICKPSHYLPHRAVFKYDSLTTPIRPVFDASCKSNRTPSLNDCLEKGPNLMELIPSVLLRFREKKIGLVSDIRKAFQMIEVDKADRDYLRFLWWEDPAKKKFKIFCHTRVVFGVNCSPFLLAAVIEFHLMKVGKSRKEMSEKLLKSFYVDNCVTSVDSMQEYEDFKTEASKLMKEANMELRLWQCSSVEVTGVGSLDQIECGLETGRAATDDPKVFETSVLGLKWNRQEDTLRCDFNSNFNMGKLTKREMLSIVQTVFDPLGIICPALLYPKILLQEAWGLKTSWDTELPMEMKDKFLDWYAELEYLKTIKIPRNVTGGVAERNSYQLHMFGDASQVAYAAAVFLRTEENGHVSVQLLQAKARVAPLKKETQGGMSRKATIPRLELMACTIGARLTDAVKRAMDFTDVPTYYWSDSTTALAWIRRNDDWGTFVGNRVLEILKFTLSAEWKHVPGKDNPADLPSRGCSPKKLLTSRWWEGPSWLHRSQDEWPSSQEPLVNEDEVNSEKKKEKTVCMVSTYTESPWYARKSTFYGNVRTVAWMKRFIAYLKKYHSNQGWLKVKEIECAEKILLKLVQKETFLKDQETVDGIRVFKDEQGLVCVKTKLLYKSDAVGFKFPILLPNSHVLVDQLIEQSHIMYGHAGVQFLMGKLRERYWILQGRRAIRSIVKKCITCRRYSVKRSEVISAPLPESRVTTSRVFQTVGVDLAGPLMVKGNKKVWILLVTCAVFRGIHLEIVESLSTEDFLNAFSRFCNIRGRPTVVYSDNGTNFVGAVTAFKSIDWEIVTKQCGLKMIDWKFNPPSAAWWGGWWERLIRSVKDILRKMMGNSKLTEGKLRHYLTDVTAFINGRPLTTVTEDPEDLIPLTPSMFMQDIPMEEYSDLDFLREKDYQNAYMQRTKILGELKMRFRKEYLGLLVQRQKEKNFVDFRVGDVVLIGDDNKKRWQWPIARIIELIRGRDGNIRVAKVRTPSGILTRPVQRLYSLEVTSHIELPSLPKMVKMKKTVDNKPPLVQENDDHVGTTRFGRKVKVPKRFGSQ